MIEKIKKWWNGKDIFHENMAEGWKNIQQKC